jgi:hypothetical protein
VRINTFEVNEWEKRRIVSEYADWIKMSEVRVQRRAFVNALVNLV